MSMKVAVTLVTILLSLSIATFHSWKRLESETDQFNELSSHIASREKPADRNPGLLAPDRLVTSAAPTVPTESAISSTVAKSTYAQAVPGIEDLRGGYPDLARDLGLMQSEADNFLRLIARQRMETEQLIHDQALYKRTLSEATLMVRERTLANEAEQAATLGGKYPLWKDYQVVTSARRQVSMLQTQLIAQGAQMSEGQMDQLATAMAAEIAQVNKEFRERIASVKPGQPVMGLAVTLPQQQKSETNRRVIAVAAPYLSPSQLDRFRQMLGQATGQPPRRPGSIP